VKFRFVAFLVGLAFSCGAVAQAQEWGTVGGGYLYQVTEGNTGHWTSFNGWYVLPTFNINKQDWRVCRLREPLRQIPEPLLSRPYAALPLLGR
jgi:hypothetical protein